MTSKEVNDPIVAMNSKNIKSDILMFKNEALKDFKEAQKKVNEKYQSLNFEVKEKLDAYEQRITAYEKKIIELSNLINTDKTIRDKVDSLIEFKEKTTDTMLTEKIRLDNFRNDLNFNVNRIDDILKSSVIYPGIIGGISKYKTFHDLIDYVLAQCSQNLTFREKSIIDLKGYKTKLESTISSFNSQINTLLNTTSEYTKTCVKECEERMKSIYNIYDDRLQDARIENANYAIGLEKATEVLKKELENLYVVKKELYEKVDNGILEVKNDNTRVVKLFTGYKKNFNVIQHKFTQLSDFIKDIRFRINLKEDIKRREYSQMSDLINFDKKKKPGFYDGVFDAKKIFKSGFGSQLKDYIEGKISADQLFKKKASYSKSVPLGKSLIDKRKSTVEPNLHVPELGGDATQNFIGLLKASLKKRLTLDQEDFNQTQNISNRNIIKEEEEDDNMSSREINGMLSKTVKVISINKDFIEKDKKNGNRKESMSKMGEKNSLEDKNEKVNKQKVEDSRIQIVSKDKDIEKKEEEKKPENKDRSSIKNVIKDLFSVKDIMDSIKNQNNNSPQKENTLNQSEKKKIIAENNNNNNNNNNNKNNSNNNNNNNNNNINNSNSINNNNSSNNIINNKNNSNTNNNNNINLINNNNNQNKKDINKNNKNFVKSANPVHRKNNKNEEQNSIRKNNTGNINNSLNSQKNRTISAAHENKKVGSYDPRAVNVNIYNATLNPITNIIQTIDKPSQKKKSNSTNQKNNKYVLKQNAFNPGYNSSYRDYGSIKKEETRKLENMYNDLVSYIPKKYEY